MTEPEDYGARDRPHISINAFLESTQYSYPSRKSKPKRTPLRENYTAHASGLVEQLTQALGGVPTAGVDTRLSLPSLKRGTLIQVATRPPEEGKYTKAVKIPVKLEFPSQDIVILRTERHEDRTESALMFVPDDARAFLQGRITDYGRDRENVPRPDVDRFEVVETIAAAPVHSLFVGEVDFESTEIVWWELWVQGAPLRAQQIADLARAENLDVHTDRLVFPDTTVVFVHAAARLLATFAARVPGAIIEMRHLTGTIEPFLNLSAGGVGPQDWVDDLAGRVTSPSEESTVVCALDTGVAGAHPLLVPGLKGAWTYDAAWGTDDHYPFGGHAQRLRALSCMATSSRT